MILKPRFTVENATGLPPRIGLALGKEEARTFAVEASGVPLVVGLSRLVWTAKASDTDPDTPVQFSLDAVITDSGSTTGIARATFTLTATSFPDTRPDAMASQVWGVFGDGRQSCGLIVDLALETPIPLNLP